MIQPLVVAAGLISIAGAATVYFSDKKIVVLGPKGSGKSSFLKFLANQELPENSNEYWTTSIMQKISNAKPFLFNGKSHKFDWENIKDINTSSLDAWEKFAQDYEILIYIFDGYRFLNEKTYLETVEEHTLRLKKIIDDNDSMLRKVKSQIKAHTVMLIANHMDKFDKASENNIHRSGKLKELILKLGGTDKCKFVAGSLDKKGNAHRLIQNILFEIE